MAVSSKLRVQLKHNAVGLEHFSTEKLRAIASSLEIVTPDNTRLVYYSDNPPSDRSLSWQPTLADGSTPVGQVKRFMNGAWRTY